MKAYSYSPAAPLTAQRSASAPALVAAYALGATLWAPMLVIVAGQFAGAFARFLPGLPLGNAASMFAAVWLLRFALYMFGAYGRWDYGYSVNGVIVSRQLSLTEKARRIARDWFGIVLVAVWMWFMAATLVAVIAGR